MARPRLSVPTYKLHKASGQACCYIDRERHYLGKYGTPESKQRFAELVSGRIAVTTADDAGKSIGPQAVPKVSELLLRFVSDELPRYSAAERRCFDGVIRIVRHLFGTTPAAEFGPLRLRVVRQNMIDGAKGADLPPLSDRFARTHDQRPADRDASDKAAGKKHQLDLFGDFNGIPAGADKTEFYQHDQNWSNRMILGDSLQVMASLAEREGLRGRVQCIYFDPP